MRRRSNTGRSTFSIRSIRRWVLSARILWALVLGDVRPLAKAPDRLFKAGDLLLLGDVADLLAFQLETTRDGVLEGVAFAFGDDPVLVDVELNVMRGERVGVVGPNGAGKSVVLGLLAGALTPDAGTRWAGPSIEVGHLSQDAGGLDRRLSVIDALRSGRSMSEETAVRKLMGFLFDYEQCRRPVGSLSGGERTRLALLALMEDGANCLLLDEPTNHLDIDSIEVFEDALEHFDGTVVAVSHDRYFLDRISDRTVVVADGGVRTYEGGWSSLAARAPLALRGCA